MTVACSPSTFAGLFSCNASIVPAFAPVLLLVIFGVAFANFKGSSTFSNALFPAAFITCLSAIAFFGLGILADYFLYATLAFGGVVAITTYFSQ